jgi:hypothetical protein
METLKKIIEAYEAWSIKYPGQNIFVFGFLVGFILGAILC